MEKNISFNSQLEKSFEDDAGKKTFRFVMNDETINSKAWKIENEGFNFADYIKYHNLVFFNHPFDSWTATSDDIIPVANIIDAFKKGKTTYADIQFNGITERSQELEKLYLGGFMTNSSVKIAITQYSEEAIPKKLRKAIPTENGNYRKATESHLLEFSLVPIGANKNTQMKKAFSEQGKSEVEIQEIFSKLGITETGENLNIINNQNEVTQMNIEEMQVSLDSTNEKLEESKVKVTELETSLTEMKSEKEALTNQITELETSTINKSEVKEMTKEFQGIIDNHEKEINVLKSDKVLSFHEKVVNDAVRDFRLVAAEKEHQLILLKSLSEMEDDTVYKAELTKIESAKPMSHLKVSLASNEIEETPALDITKISQESFQEPAIRKAIVLECQKRAEKNNTSFQAEFDIVKKANNL